MKAGVKLFDAEDHAFCYSALSGPQNTRRIVYATFNFNNEGRRVFSHAHVVINGDSLCGVLGPPTRMPKLHP